MALPDIVLVLSVFLVQLHLLVLGSHPGHLLNFRRIDQLTPLSASKAQSSSVPQDQPIAAGVGAQSAPKMFWKFSTILLGERAFDAVSR